MTRIPHANEAPAFSRIAAHRARCHRRAAERALPDGYRVALSDVVVEVTALTEDGRPKEVELTFEHELEHPSLRWVRYEAGRYVPFAIPAVGEGIVLEAVPFSLFAPPPASAEK